MLFQQIKHKNCKQTADLPKFRPRVLQVTTANYGHLWGLQINHGHCDQPTQKKKGNEILSGHIKHLVIKRYNVISNS